MKHTLTLLAAALSFSAQAADLTFSGQATFHNDKVIIDFSVAAGSTVSLWTDSWQSGLNFDPQLFVASGNVIVLKNDDNDVPGLTGTGYYDSGLQFTALTAGSYRLVLNAASNDALGTLLSQGFAYDGDTPIKLSDWNQPSYDMNANDQKGGFWRIHLDGVEQAAVVPEPSAWMLLLPGVLALGLMARRKR